MKAKNIIVLFFSFFVLASCTKDFEEINKNPNEPENVETGYVLTYAQKNIMDNLRDEWFGGRTTYLLSQYWAQRNYTEEDRYAFRSTVTDAAWRQLYLSLKNLDAIIQKNNDADLKGAVSASGDNENQIAVANILSVYVFSVLTDCFGDIPYSEAFKGADVKLPKFDKQSDIYVDLIAKLKASASSINLKPKNALVGDVVYSGDMLKWKKFANSLRLRLALRISKADGGVALNDVKTLAAEEFFTSNDDNAAFKYKTIDPNTSPIYKTYFVDKRNDFTISKPFMLILSGANDDLNPTKSVNPFSGLVDPRIDVFAYKVGGKYFGMPYGTNNELASSLAGSCPDFMENPSLVQTSDFAYSFMDYAEVCFIMSELNAWDQTWYEKGVKASLTAWGVKTVDIDAYMLALPVANQERVLTQKYIALYTQPEQAWFEYKRTGYPKMLLHPGEISYKNASGNVVFEPLEGTDIPRRLTYPVEEYNLNKLNTDAAAVAIGGDKLETKVWWDK